MNSLKINRFAGDEVSKGQDNLGQLPPHKCESLQLRSTAIHRKQELLGCFGFNTHRVGLVDNSLPAAPNSPAGTCVS